jgi:hypothetical protein
MTINRDRVRLRSTLPVDTLLPPSDPAPPEQASGWRLELTDRAGNVRYRRSLPDIAQRTVEFPTGNPEGPIARYERPPGPVPFVVFIPDLADARTVQIYGHGAADPDGPARLIARLNVGSERALR